MKKFPFFMLFFVYFIALSSCQSTSNIVNETAFNKVDEVSSRISQNATTQKLDKIVTIDHARLAIEAGSPMNASIVGIYSNKSLNSRLLAIDQLIGLDLPYRVLSYAEPNSSESRIAYAPKEYLMKRHRKLRNSKLLDEYEQDMQELISGNENIVSMFDTEKVTSNYGIITLESSFNFDSTISKLKNIILNQGDTVWFGEVNYSTEARRFDINIPNTKLLLFGAPAPGGDAMAEYPKLGLDAFCQKVLVYEQEGRVYVSYNNIVELSQMHYDDTAIAHRIINFRLSNTFKGAISE